MLAALVLVLSPCAQDPALVRARELQAEGANERALQRLEAELATHPDDGALLRARAEALERFVDEGGPWPALSAARASWDRALAGAPEDLELQCGAIAVRLRLGEYDGATALAERALGAAWLAGGKAPPVLLELACRARLGALPAHDAMAPAERSAAVARAWSALRHARTLAPDSEELVRLAAGLLAAEGLPARASEELVAALERAPTASALHRALIDLYLREGLEERLSALYERWSASGTNATLAWFTAEAWRVGGDLAQRERRFEPALAAYARATQWMGVAATLESKWQAPAETLRFQTQLSSGWCELDSGALDAAGERLLGLLRASPARCDQPDGLGRTLRAALARLAERRADTQAFARAADEARAIVTLLPAAGEWWGRLGSALCEQARQGATDAGLQREQSEARSRALWRESWQAYQRALALRSDDARLLVDAARVQVEFLRDGLAEAEGLLERALELGEARLAALGPEPDECVRFPLAQVLGDAYQELGLLNYHVYRQAARARDAFERALATDSGARPELGEYLAALDGRRGPVPQPEPRPQSSFSEAAVSAGVAWEADLGEARARAAREGRALLVYNRGHALGRAVPALDQQVCAAEFARATRDAVLLLADFERLTFVERRRDGRRLSCPRFGTVTCGEHVRAAEELEAWLSEVLGAPPGESEQGLWLLVPGAEVPGRLDGLARLAELAPANAPLEASAALGAGPFEALEASLGGERGDSEARALVSEHSLGARLLLERVLWDGFRSGPARGSLLAALAEDGNPSSGELLAACVRQGVDPELQQAALALWPPNLGLEPIVHVLNWSPRPELRALAAEVLARERPDDPALRADEVLRAH